MSRFSSCAIPVVIFQLLAMSSALFCRPSNVLMAVVVHRHGARTPLGETYANDPYRNASNWPEGWAQLTETGKAMMYEFGSDLRNRYIQLLPKNYHERDVYVRSTDTDRTLMSSCALLAGLYPAKYEETIRCPVVPIHSIPREIDPVVAMKKPCPKHAKLRAEILPIINEFDANHTELYANLTELTGENITTVRQADLIFDALEVESTHGMALPNWTADYFPEKLLEISRFFFMLDSYTPEMARLKTGPFFHELLGRLRSRRELITDRKLVLYSAHESVIANLLMALGNYDSVPPYSAYLVIELCRNDNLLIYYHNETRPRMLKFGTYCTNHSTCTFTEFEKNLEQLQMSVEDWEKECNL